MAEVDQNAVVHNAAVQRLRQEAAFRNGANWFFWIAGLSLTNSVVYAFGGGFMMLLGLASSLMSIAFMKGFGGAGIAVGLVITVIIAGMFAMFGYFARKRAQWAFIVGLGLYVIDGGIFLAFGDFLPALFHVIVAVGIFSGYRALKALDSAVPPPAPPAMAGVAVGPPPVPSAPSMSAEMPLPEPNQMPPSGDGV